MRRYSQGRYSYCLPGEKWENIPREDVDLWEVLFFSSEPQILQLVSRGGYFFSVVICVCELPWYWFSNPMSCQSAVYWSSAAGNIRPTSRVSCTTTMDILFRWVVGSSRNIFFCHHPSLGVIIPSQDILTSNDTHTRTVQTCNISNYQTPQQHNYVFCIYTLPFSTSHVCIPT